MKTINYLLLLVVTMFMVSCNKDNAPSPNAPEITVKLYTPVSLKGSKNPMFGQLAKSNSINQLQLSKGIVAQSNTVPNTLSVVQENTGNFVFPNYTHSQPTAFVAYFISTDGSEPVKKVLSLVENVHEITVPAKEYKVIVTNFPANYTLSLGRNLLPEVSTMLYFYGENTIDYTTTAEGTVEVTNDYASALIYKNEVVKSTPKSGGINAMTYPAIDYYVLYLRDTNGATSFTKSIQADVLTRNGSTQNYSFSDTFTPNVSQYYLLQVNDDTRLNLVVADDILNTKKEGIVETP